MPDHRNDIRVPNLRTGTNKKVRPPRPYLQEIWLKRETVPDFDRYPFSVPAVKNMDRIRFHPDVTFLIGENGTGKSTLLEAIADLWGFNVEGGNRNFQFATRDRELELSSFLGLSRSASRPWDGFFLRAESFFNVATEIDKLGIAHSYGGKSLHEQSHGESFLSLMMNRFQGNAIYLLDEPEAALSPMRQLSILRRIHDLVEEESQFIIATHSPIILAYPRARILELNGEGLREVKYEETEHYRVTRQFFEHRERMLEELLSGDAT